MTDASKDTSTIARVVVLSGGHGGSKFVEGLLHGIATGQLPGVAADAHVTVVANTADDLWMHGVKVSPDIDTLLYTLGGGFDHERGWGRKEETWSIMAELTAYGLDTTWFGLGDRDFATHILRTQLLDADYTLSEVVEAFAKRWLTAYNQPGGPGLTLLPMSDDRVETHVVIADPAEPSGKRVVHFQEYWVKLHAQAPVEGLLFLGLDEAVPAPGVLEALREADLVIIPPSNPVVSVGTILGVDGVREAVLASRGRVIGVSPIIDGHHVRGMAEQMLGAIGVEADALAVGRHYGSRADGGLLDLWLVDPADATDDAPHVLGVPIWMTTPQHTVDFVRVALEALRA